MLSTARRNWETVYWLLFSNHYEVSGNVSRICGLCCRIGFDVWKGRLKSIFTNFVFHQFKYVLMRASPTAYRI